MDSLDLTEKATILVVDATPDSLDLVAALPRGAYKVVVADCGALGLRLAAASERPDVILLDTTLPDMDGYEVCSRLKANPATSDIPVIFLTTSNQIGHEAKGLGLGAIDYIAKPISPPIVRARLATHLALKAGADYQYQRHAPGDPGKAGGGSVAEMQDATIFAMATLAEVRDAESGKHILRTKHFVKLLAQRLKENPRYKATLTERYINVLFKSTPLCDVGEIGIPDRVLLKPGPLTPAEFEIMKTHTTLGHNAMEMAEKTLGESMTFLGIAKEIALSHHERWDGSGYPQGLAGDQIPLAARIMTIADVYDALTSDRVYKSGVAHDKAVSIIFQGRGAHFDPDMVDVFIEIHDEFRATAELYADTEADLQRKMEYIANAIAEEVQM